MARLSFAVNVGLGRGESLVEPLELRVAGRPVPLLPASRTEREAVYVTKKLTPADGEMSVVFVADHELRYPRRFGIELHRWARTEN